MQDSWAGDGGQGELEKQGKRGTSRRPARPRRVRMSTCLQGGHHAKRAQCHLTKAPSISWLPSDTASRRAAQSDSEHTVGGSLTALSKKLGGADSPPEAARAGA